MDRTCMSLNREDLERYGHNSADVTDEEMWFLADRVGKYFDDAMNEAVDSAMEALALLREGRRRLKQMG